MTLLVYRLQVPYSARFAEGIVSGPETSGFDATRILSSPQALSIELRVRVSCL